MNVIDVAKKMETDAIQFYSEAAKKTSYPAGKKMFETIAEDEKRHLEIVTKLIEGLDFQVEDNHPLQRVKTVFEEMKDDMMDKVAASSMILKHLK